MAQKLIMTGLPRNSLSLTSSPARLRRVKSGASELTVGAGPVPGDLRYSIRLFSARLVCHSFLRLSASCSELAPATNVPMYLLMRYASRSSGAVVRVRLYFSTWPSSPLRTHVPVQHALHCGSNSCSETDTRALGPAFAACGLSAFQHLPGLCGARRSCKLRTSPRQVNLPRYVPVVDVSRSRGHGV